MDRIRFIVENSIKIQQKQHCHITVQESVLRIGEIRTEQEHCFTLILCVFFFYFLKASTAFKAHVF